MINQLALLLDVSSMVQNAVKLLLAPEQLQFFNDNGYLVLEDFASQDEVAKLKERAEQIIEEYDASNPSVFSTVNQKFRTDNQFLDSANGVAVFLEEKAMDGDNRLQKPKQQAVNKIGHAMHDLDPVFRQFSRSEKMQALFRSLAFERPLPVQSMYICKQPKIGGEVVPHQDSSFLWTDPPTATGIWVALEDATKANGCLWTWPKSHKSDVHRRFKRKQDDSVWFDGEQPPYDLEKFVPLEVKAGALVLLHGANVHFSYENTSPHSRHAYSMHVVDSGPKVAWSQDNWLQRSPDFPFRPLFVDMAT